MHTQRVLISIVYAKCPYHVTYLVRLLAKATKRKTKTKSVTVKLYDLPYPVSLIRLFLILAHAEGKVAQFAMFDVATLISEPRYKNNPLF